MPSVKLPRKSTDTDMTPFVDVAFLILSFFMLATKFKPPEPVDIKQPSSVLAEKLPENDAVLITIDSSGRVFFTVMAQKEPQIKADIAEKVSELRSLNLTKEQLNAFKNEYMVGIPLASLASFLSKSDDDRKTIVHPGIPVLDSATNELVWWINASIKAYAEKGIKLRDFLIKGDGRSKFPVFEAVLSALKRNEEFRYQLVTDLEGIPGDSELSKYEMRKKK